MGERSYDLSGIPALGSYDSRLGRRERAGRAGRVRGMRATMMLCDAAQVADGKLYILGGGWSITGPDPAPSGLAIKIEVGWNEAEQGHHWELFLVDADGGDVTFDTPDGRQPVEIRGDFETGRPTGIPEGSPVDVPLAINLGPIPLTPGTRYTWRLVIDGEQREDWTVGF